MDTTVTLPSTLQDDVDGALASAIEQRWASRIWARDTSLWTDEESVAASIAHRLGWLDAPTAFVEEVAELTAFGEQIAQEGYTDVLVCGMGGSSLAPEVLSRVYPESDKGLDIHVLDSTDPAAVAAYDALLDPARTLRIIATKSGSTTETLALLAHHWEAEEHRVGRFPRTKAGNGFVSISDPGGPLEAIPHASYFRETFLNPADVGGRYSALTYVGLVPAALLWLDLDPLLEDARIMATATRADSLDNPALVLGVALATLARAGRDKLTFVIEPDLAPLGAWLEQLIAESTGKQGKGIVPVDGEPLAAPERYADDRVFVRLGPADAAEWHSQTDPALAALVAAGHPLIDIRLDEASWVAAEFFRWEFATAVAGVALGVNPFDEPNVTESKHNTSAVLDVFAQEGRLPAPEPSATTRVTQGLAARRRRRRPGGAASPAHRQRARARLPLDRRLHRPQRGAHAAAAGAAGRPARWHRSGYDLRLRPALPALHWPAAQGRRADRVLHPAHLWPPGRHRHPRSPRDVRGARRCPGHG